LVTLPFVLLLLDYWPLNRWQKTLEALTEKRFYAAGKLISEKIPFFILTIAISILTFWVQNKSGAMAQVDSIPFDMRLSNAIFSYLVYLGKILLPTNMSIFYPYEFTIPLIKILISTIVLTATTLFVFYYIKTIPFLFVGWFWFLGTLVPVIGLVQVGSQAMADRYTYLPSIGISIILAWGFPRLSQTVKINKIILIFTAITVLFTLSFLTWIHCGYWKNSITIFNHALRVSKDNYLAYNNFGVALSAEGMIKEAIENYDKAIRVKPNHAEAYNNRGNAYIKIGLYQPAIEDYKMAILIKPDYAEAYNNYGSAYLLQGNTDLGCPLAQKACVMGICKALEKAKGNGFCR
ncbi:MAG: tetratricopeptide repeat protein, partial [Smithella sp.]